MERVMIFIDGSNLYKALQEKYDRTRFNILKFSEKLCGDRKLMKIMYYNAAIPMEMNEERSIAQQRFFDAIEKLPYVKVMKGRLEKRGNTWVEKGVDIMIATDMIINAVNDNYDVAILVSSDGDFKYVVEEVGRFGKHVENAYVEGFKANHLNVCDNFIKIDDFINECWLS